MGTGKGISHTGACQRVGSCRRIALGEILIVDDRVMDAAKHNGMCITI